MPKWCSEILPFWRRRCACSPSLRSAFGQVKVHAHAHSVRLKIKGRSPPPPLCSLASYISLSLFLYFLGGWVGLGGGRWGGGGGVVRRNCVVFWKFLTGIRHLTCFYHNSCTRCVSVLQKHVLTHSFQPSSWNLTSIIWFTAGINFNFHALE